VNSDDPLQTASQTDRDERGQFIRGNRGGPGNPGIGELAKHRVHFAKSIQLEDIDAVIAVIRRVMANGKDGDALRAAFDLLNRTIGVPFSSEGREIVERIQARFEELGIKDDQK
jgi:hypothetical protein